MTNLKIVTVEWDDTCSNGGWMPKDQARMDWKVLSTGLLLSRDKREIVLAQSMVHGRDTVADTITIPMGVVRKVTTVGKVSLKKVQP